MGVAEATWRLDFSVLEVKKRPVCDYRLSQGNTEDRDFRFCCCEQCNMRAMRKLKLLVSAAQVHRKERVLGVRV